MPNTSFFAGLTTGSLAVPADRSLVVGVLTSNNFPTIAGPFSNDLYNGDSGSSTADAGYQIEPVAGTLDYSWTVTGTGGAGYSNALAAFVPVTAGPTNTLANWISNPASDLTASYT